MKGLIPYVVALVGVSGVAMAQQLAPPPELRPPEQSPTTAEPDSGPRRLTIDISVTDPEDLKVAEGDRVEAGQLLADRSRDRTRLEAQSRQLSLTLQQLETATITPPLSPAQAPTVAALPQANHFEQEAAIERAKVAVQQAERSLQQKQQEIDYLQSLDNLDPLVLEHEQAKLSELQQTHTATVRDYQLAMGRLGNAQDEAAYREYRHSLTIAERVEQANQSAMAYQRQWAEYEQRLRDREYRVAQTQLQLDEVENAIATLSVVRSPYPGRIRRIKWLGQNPDGTLSVEITLLVRARPSTDGAAPLPGQQPDLFSNPDGASDSEFLGD